MKYLEHLHVTKRELRYGAIALGILGIIAFALHKKTKPATLLQSSPTTGQPVALTQGDLGPLPDFAGLDGVGMPYGAGSVSGDGPFARDFASGPMLFPDPTMAIQPGGDHSCGC